MKRMRVVIMKTNGEYFTTFEGVVRIAPLSNGKFLIDKELTNEEMKLYNMNPDEVENNKVYTYDSKDYYFIVSMMQ